MTKQVKAPAADPAFAYFRNQSPQGALQLPLVGNKVVPFGEVVAVPIERAHLLEGQEVWAPVDGPDPEPDTNDSGSAAESTEE